MATLQDSEESKQQRKPYRDPGEYRASIIAIAEVMFSMLIDRALGDADLEKYGEAHFWLHIETVQRLIELQITVLSTIETAEVQTARTAVVEQARGSAVGNVIVFPGRS